MINLKSCPTCGSKRIRRVTRTLTRASRGKRFTVPQVTFHECPNCGEQVFSPEALNKIAERRGRLRRTAA